MKIAAAYIRVSDDRQDEYSPDSQLKLVRAYAEKNGYIVPDEYVFYDDGISAKSAKNRHSFNMMIALAKEKKPPFEAILVWKFSRFARNQEESIVYKNILKKKGVSVISTSEPIIEGPFGALIERIIEWMDEYYSINLSVEVKRGMTEKASRGEAMSRQFGYDLLDKKTFIPNAEAETVKYVFEKFAAGESMKSLATELGSRGVRTFRGNKPDNRFVEYMLNNPVYIGKIRWSTDGRAASRRKYNDEKVMIADGTHQPIITEALWEEAQERLKRLKRMYGHYQRREQPIEFALKGLVRCGDCGATLVRISTACPSIQCHNYSRGLCRRSHSLSLSKANKAVIEALEQSVNTLSFKIDPKVPAASGASALTGTDWGALIAEEYKMLERAEQLYIKGKRPMEWMEAQEAAIKAEIARLEEEQAMSKAPAPFDPEQYAKKVTEVINFIKSPNESEPDKNSMLRSIISKIIYDKDTQSLKIYFYI